MQTWRRHFFSAGGKYRVLKEFRNELSEFHKGEVVTFKHDAYSAYDSSTAFVFESSTGQLKTWLLADDDIDDGHDRFAAATP
jgi:hypothetical protein